MVNNTQNFIEAARAYCTWAESDRQGADIDTHLALHHLSKIYHFALSLPDQSGDAEEPDIPEEQVHSILASFAQMPVGYYGECFDPLVVPAEEPSLGDVADDLTDIWCDLKRGLIQHDAGHTNAAIWTWKFHFKAHWGLHAASGMRALHCWLVSNS